MIETKLNGLKELKELLDAGTISVGEFEQLKKDILSSKGDNSVANSKSLTTDAQTSDLVTESQKSTSNTLVIITAAILLLAFFMPWVDVIFSLSAYDLVFGNVGDYIIPPVRFFAALIPISAIIMLISAINQGRYFIWKPLLFSIPLLSLILISLIINKETGIGEALKVDGVLEALIEEMSKTFKIGFWLTLIGSLVLFLSGFISKPNSSTN